MNKYLRILLVIAMFLSLVFITSQFTDEVKWSISDYFMMGGLLLAVSFTTTFILSKIVKTQLRLLFIGVMVLVFMLIWAELAVGIFNTPFAGK